MDEREPYRIRQFKWPDLDRILEIEAQAFPKTPYSRDIFRHFSGSLSDTFIVIETGADIAGYMIFDRKGHVHSTAVGLEFRRRGFGSRLFDYASKNTRRALWLEVRSKNKAAISFYRSLGMGVIGRIPNYYGDDDALVMMSSR